MIHDKDYMIRMVREFSSFLSKLLLGKNEGDPDDNRMAFETQMKDIFHINYEDLVAKSKEEINAMILEKEDHHQADHYDLLGNLFYYKFKERPDADLAAKAKMFYELWLQKSSTFSLPVMGRISELQNAL